MRPRSKALFKQAQLHIPGGVNSPVRAFKAVGGNPLFIKKAKGAYLTDEDEQQYIDMINSWGPMILGHAHPVVEKAVRDAIGNSLSFGAPTSREIEMAELICTMVDSIEMVRMVNSGTEATMSAVRLARGYTKKSKLIKFEGNYHGHGDSFLIAAGSGAATFGNPDSPGVTQGVANDTLTVKYNDLQAVEELVAANKNDVAAIILEPVVGNMGCVLPEKGFLEGLRSLCDKENIVLIFDEVMTGFRLSKAGAQGVFGISPDLSTFGKIIGGGMPVGAYGGKKEIMQHVSPSGKVYQAGTLSGNPIAMAAGLAMLHYLNDHAEVYEQLENTTKKITAGIQDILDQKKLNYTINQIGSMFSLFFTDRKVKNFDDAQTCDMDAFSNYFQSMLNKGVYLAPSQYESLFVSAAIEEQEIQKILESVATSL